MFGTSFEGETSSPGSLDALILNIGERTDRVEVLMPPSSLSGEEILVNLQRRYRARNFNQTCLRIIGCETSGVEVLRDLNLQRRSDV